MVYGLAFSSSFTFSKQISRSSYLSIRYFWGAEISLGANELFEIGLFALVETFVPYLTGNFLEGAEATGCFLVAVAADFFTVVVEDLTLLVSWRV